jgi:hypothetical protein
MQSLGEEQPSLRGTNKVVPGLHQNCISNLTQIQSLSQELPSLGGTNKGSSRLISILELIKFDLIYGVMDSMNRKVIVTGFRTISGVVTGKYFSWKEGYL